MKNYLCFLPLHLPLLSHNNILSEIRSRCSWEKLGKLWTLYFLHFAERLFLRKCACPCKTCCHDAVVFGFFNLWLKCFLSKKKLWSYRRKSPKLWIIITLTASFLWCSSVYDENMRWMYLVYYPWSEGWRTEVIISPSTVAKVSCTGRFSAAAYSFFHFRCFTWRCEGER